MRTRGFWVVAGIVIALAPACGSSGAEAPPVPVEDAGSDLADTNAGDGATATDSGDDANGCDPPCGAGSICCTDQHGHFPQCVDGASCP